MNRVLIVCFASMLFLTAHLVARAQDDPRPFNPLAASVENAIKEQFPNWKRTSIPPAQPNGSETFTEDVIIDQWRSEEVGVRVAILIHSSQEEAKKVFRKSVANVRINESVLGVGEESYIWGIDKSVAFRKGRYTVYISATPIIEEEESTNPTAAPETSKYGKTIAHIVAKVLKDL